MNILKALFLICGLLFFPFRSLHAQEISHNTPLLLKTGELSSFRVFRISQQLGEIKGVHFLGYLAKAQTLMITYEKAHIDDLSEIINIVESMNNGNCATPLVCDNIYNFIDSSEKEADVNVLNSSTDLAIPVSPIEEYLIYLNAN